MSFNAVGAAVDCGYCQCEHLEVELLNATVLADDLHAQVCALVIVCTVQEATGAVEDVVHAHDGCSAQSSLVSGVAQVLLSLCSNLNNNRVNLGCCCGCEDCTPELLLGQGGNAGREDRLRFMSFA